MKPLRFPSRTFLHKSVAVTLLALSGVASGGRPAVAGAVADTVVLDWNLIAVQAVGATPPFPSTRAVASVQLAVFDAVNAITQRFQP